MVGVLETKGDNNTKEEQQDENVYVILDSQNKFADMYSLFVNKNKKLIYRPSDNLLNGSKYFRIIDVARNHLTNLNDLSLIHKKDYKFRIELINLQEIIKKELLNA